MKSWAFMVVHESNCTRGQLLHKHPILHKHHLTECSYRSPEGGGGQSTEKVSFPAVAPSNKISFTRTRRRISFSGPKLIITQIRVVCIFCYQMHI